MAWIGALIGVAGNYLLNSSSGGSSAASAADPFAGQRPQYQAALGSLMSGQGFTGGGAPSTFSPHPPGSSDPFSGLSESSGGVGGMISGLLTRNGYQQQGIGNPGNGMPSGADPSYMWRLSQGMGNTDRQLAAGGFLNSGNRAAALMDYAQGSASTEYANQFSRLSQLAGANVGSPAAAGQIIQGQQGAAAAYGQQLIAPIVKSIGTGISNWWNNKTPSDTTTTPDYGSDPTQA